MGTIVCQICDETIEVFEDEKVTVLYGQCGCKKGHNHHSKEV